MMTKWANNELWGLVVQVPVDGNIRCGQLMTSGAYSLLNDELNKQTMNSGAYSLLNDVLTIQVMNSGALWFVSRGAF